MNQYKAEHEAFVSNMKGTSVGCIFACLAHAPALILILKGSQGFNTPNILRDFVFLVVPTLLTITVASDYNYLTLVCMYALIGAYLFSSSKRMTLDSLFNEKAANARNVESHSHNNTSYLTLFKGMLVYAYSNESNRIILTAGIDV